MIRVRILLPFSAPLCAKHRWYSCRISVTIPACRWQRHFQIEFTILWTFLFIDAIRTSLHSFRSIRSRRENQAGKDARLQQGDLTGAAKYNEPS